MIYLIRIVSKIPQYQSFTLFNNGDPYSIQKFFLKKQKLSILMIERKSLTFFFEYQLESQNVNE